MDLHLKARDDVGRPLDEITVEVADDEILLLYVI
jgi:hypothetical protein